MVTTMQKELAWGRGLKNIQGPELRGRGLFQGRSQGPVISARSLKPHFWIQPCESFTLHKLEKYWEAAWYRDSLRRLWSERQLRNNRLLFKKLHRCGIL